MEDLYDNLLVELECPICTNYMAPPIRQCATGHSICESCRKKLSKCPLCQGTFTESKNISLEALAVKMHYPCVFRSQGCPTKLVLQDREEHEANCFYRGFKCGMDRCPWVGRLEDVLEHWNSKKMKSKSYQMSNICHTKVKAESYYVNLVDAHECLFWFKCKLEKGKIFWAVQLLGNKNDATDYFYEIELFKPGYNKRKILFTEYCQPADIENSNLFQDDVCVNINISCLNRFVGDDQLLIYYMRVLKDVESDKGQAGPNKANKKHFQKQKSPQVGGNNPLAFKHKQYKSAMSQENLCKK